MPQRQFYCSRGEQVASRAIGRCRRFLYRSNDADLKRPRPILPSPVGPHRLVATCNGEFVPGSGAPVVAHTAMPMASASSTVFTAILSSDISRRLSRVSAVNLKNYAAGPEMVCPGGALSFPALGP